MTTINERADKSWDECIVCSAAKASRFFCEGCLDSGADEELNKDNPILHRDESSLVASPRHPHGGGPTGKRTRSPEEVRRIQEQLQWLADHPGVVERLHGHRELDGLRHLPHDSRRPTDAQSEHRYMADYSSPRRDQRVNWGILL